jgi:2-polyprenyl-3-methyl-5-hydroxy-6-metoxy-1,4-benzoquinol methylase
MNESDDSARSATCAVCKTVLPRRVAVRVATCCLYTCGTCGSWTYFPRGGAAGQAALHNNDVYFDHPYFMLRRTPTLAQRRRCQDVSARLSAALQLSSLRGQRWLDIGCDTGLFLKTVQQEFGILPVGIDVSERAVRMAREQGVEAYQLTIEDAPAEMADFPLATAIDLIEHVADPHEFLQRVRERMLPGGVVYLETPNIHSWVYRFGRALLRVTGGRPRALVERLFPPQHIQYFTRESLASLARVAGFEVVSLTQRALPSSDIAASRLALLAMAALQSCDRLSRTEILLCAVLRRPHQRSEASNA